jgi:alkyl sulfatase BDS1-like metallo-beta-lactamase superfamily hydrolase
MNVVLVPWPTQNAAANDGAAVMSHGPERTMELPKPATAQTKNANARFLDRLPLSNAQDFEDAQRGFLAPLPDNGVVRNAKNTVVFDAGSYAIPLDAAAPDTVNPSLWRQSKLVGFSGLFKVVDRIYQVRGIDLSNITFIEGEKGVIVVDPLISMETAKSALELYYQHRPKRPVTVVLYTHSHVDHFGGVRGVVDKADVKAGKVRIVAPKCFVEEAISENVMTGNAMGRRASYMYGSLLPHGARGAVGSGLGMGTSSGSITMLSPAEIVEKTGQKLTLDGLEFEFLYAPGSEAPAEMHFYIPQLKALCTAENATHTLHNFYSLRGTKTRDVKAWVTYLNETLDRWGDKADVLLQVHHWPTWGNANIVDHIEKYRDTLKYIHDQVLHLANQGYTMLEIAEMIELPESLAGNWSSRDYYGSVSHNAKAVYNFYLGYFSGNPADLHPLPPADAAKRYVEMMGGADAVLQKAREYFRKGDYRWVAQVVNHVVLADPKNQDAKNLEADALEQLGYQAENATWRNFYLSGAQELRSGVRRMTTAGAAPPDLIANMPLDQILDYLGIALDSKRAAGKSIAVNFEFTDVKQTYGVTIKNSVLNYRRKPIVGPGATVSLARSDLTEILVDKMALLKLIGKGRIRVDGDANRLLEMLSLFDSFDFWFNIVTPNAPPGAR